MDGRPPAEGEPRPYRSVPFYVESDWSAASYWYQAATLADEAEIILPGLFEASCQGDSQVASIFRPLGIATEYGQRTVTLRKAGTPVAHLDYDFTHQPDLAQTLVVTCALKGITFRFSACRA